MKTPITDAAEFPAHQATRFHYGEDPLVDASLARLLEADRAALMEALERISNQRPNRYESTVGLVCNIADAALSTARANFPAQP